MPHAKDEHNRASGARESGTEIASTHSLAALGHHPRGKETDDDDGPANSVPVLLEATMRANKLATEKQNAQ
jgi:hypothetical protein